MQDFQELIQVLSRTFYALIFLNPQSDFQELVSEKNQSNSAKANNHNNKQICIAP